MPLLELRDVETSYGLSRVLFGISLAHRAGRNGVAAGPQRHGQDHDRALDHGADAGCGGLDPIRRRGDPRNCRPIASPSSASVWCRRAARCFPISPRAKIWSPPPPIAAALPNRGRSKRVLALFPRLAERAGSMANLLSGGEQQMLAIGRALMTNPRLLILDEATEGLAPLIRDEIWRCLEQPARGRPIDPGDRQKCRGAHPHRRPPLHHRARPRGVDAEVRSNWRARRKFSTAISGFSGRRQTRAFALRLFPL